MKTFILATLIFLLVCSCTGSHSGDTFKVVKVEQWRESTNRYTLALNSGIAGELHIYVRPTGWQVGDTLRLVKE